MSTPIPRHRLIIAAILTPLLLVSIWYIQDYARPNILAEVTIGPTGITIRNSNTASWPRPTISLNSPITGARLKISDDWPAGETHTIPYQKFTRRGGAAFDPSTESVEHIIIRVPGYSVCTYSF